MIDLTVIGTDPPNKYNLNCNRNRFSISMRGLHIQIHITDNKTLFVLKSTREMNQVKVLTTTKSCFLSVSSIAIMFNSFSFTAQRKVEFENFRFKHPSMLAVVIESINTQVIDT